MIHDRYAGLSNSYQKIALYITQNPNAIAVDSVHVVSEKCGVHASGFVRFAQSLGYKGFKDLQTIFRHRLSTAALGFNARVKALEDELDTREDRTERGFLQDLIGRDISSLQELLANISPEQIVQAVDLMEQADTIYLIGQLRSAPVVELLRYTLTMLGKRTVLLDTAGDLPPIWPRSFAPLICCSLFPFAFMPAKSSISWRKLPSVRYRSWRSATAPFPRWRVAQRCCFACQSMNIRFHARWQPPCV